MVIRVLVSEGFSIPVATAATWLSIWSTGVYVFSFPNILTDIVFVFLRVAILTTIRWNLNLVLSYITLVTEDAECFLRGCWAFVLQHVLQKRQQVILEKRSAWRRTKLDPCFSLFTNTKRTEDLSTRPWTANMTEKNSMLVRAFWKGSQSLTNRTLYWQMEPNGIKNPCTAKEPIKWTVSLQSQENSCTLYILKTLD